MTPAVSIIIPTFRRPDRAVDAARSALAQVCEATFEVVLVDNDPAGSALAQLRAMADARITVIHEPHAGVANARNAGLRAARGDMIAFLDDDEIAPEAWLAELLRVQRATRPTQSLVPCAPGSHRPRATMRHSSTPSSPATPATPKARSISSTVAVAA